MLHIPDMELKDNIKKAISIGRCSVPFLCIKDTSNVLKIPQIKKRLIIIGMCYLVAIIGVILLLFPKIIEIVYIREIMMTMHSQVNHMTKI